MRRSIAVIGANFGDEGKGRVTDALVTPDSLVVRFNGGGQAGHTVKHKHVKHVFSHFGSGSIVGAPTLLSPFFVLNPIVFANELGELLYKKIMPRVFVDSLCSVTTPYEVAINRELERKRGGARHGSCGVGFGETVHREKHGITVRLWEDLGPALALARSYALIRCQELELDSAAVLAAAEKETHDWLYCVELMRSRVNRCHSHDLIKKTDHVVFEGAQGLLLSQDSDFFPHVTHSYTGLRNVMELTRGELQQVIYVTRTYLTRHGAGPLPGEDPDLSYPDETNKDGEFQGSLRFAPLDLALLKRSIRLDLGGTFGVRPALALTCIDQFGGADASRGIELAVGLPVAYSSHGPEREDAAWAQSVAA